jgi:tetratricopeptide (TPR) repeat protein
MDSLSKQITSHSQLAYILYLLGELTDNVSGFQLAEMLQARYQPEFPQLYGKAGVQYCALLLERARDVTEREAILIRAQYALALSTKYLGISKQALDHLTIARTLAALHRPTESLTAFATAVTLMRQTGHFYDLPEILVHYTKFLREQGNFYEAQQYLNELLDIALHYGMQLYEAEAYLLQGHLLLDHRYQKNAMLHEMKGDGGLPRVRLPHQVDNTLKDAELAYQQAAKLIKNMDYGLRLAELSLLAARLAHYGQRSHDAITHLNTAKQHIHSVGQWGLFPLWERISAEIR